MKHSSLRGPVVINPGGFATWLRRCWAWPRRTSPSALESSQQLRGVHAAVVFLNWLKAHDLTLSTCRQANLDQWLTDDLAAYRQAAGHFVRWARTRKLTTVDTLAVRWNSPTHPLDDEHRWNVAGLFLLHYPKDPRRSASWAPRTSRPTLRKYAPRQRPRSATRACRPTGPHCRREPHGTHAHRRPGTVSMALPRRPARTADQHHTAHAAAEPVRGPAQPGPRHRALPTSHRDQPAPVRTVNGANVV
ncbi:hypothetical protein NKH77_51235 [Streptomyces sp. M19]